MSLAPIYRARRGKILWQPGRRAQNQIF